MGLEAKYRKSLSEQWCLRFKTNHPEGEAYDGIVTHIKRRFVVLREERDFELDGVVILPKNVICGSRDNKYDRCCNAILRHQGALSKLSAPKWLDECNTLADVLRDLQQRDIWPAVEVFQNRRRATGFYLGPITQVEASMFCINCYDAAGKWEHVYGLDVDQIFRIEFDTRYCNSFNEFMRTKRVT